MTIDSITTDATIKQRHRAMWASGDYPAVADVIADLGPQLVTATGIGASDKVVDIAAGAGNVAVPAARTGAHVVATDLTPELLQTGESRFPDLGIVWRTADAEYLPFDDDTFDVAVSCVGVMFAPHHQECADELARVTRTGGRIGLINWTPTGFIGELFKVMKPYAPAPPPGAQPGVLWGDATHVAGLFGERVHDLVATTATLEVTDFADGAAFRDFFKATYGPTIAAYRTIGDDTDRAAELDAAIAGLADRYLHDGVMQWEYLQVTATVAG
ncbi:methyltransferase domain-containing protein [Gordonia sp. HNM0687]|uniref:Methyltransferase domain-containing protein n=1 Tax=Gordonia mangrovi TaxID=2665643 RepID=A0A6L7GSV7_9ACTN|nr:class I SAM-dependent methyltransferase [Gordonia mangrovi]MXP21608.1 methyltransferase domain-containing protein [Gordonia mangrovi]UVF80350.1 class I SAM-dependent methyltransferase [Gordonia mangrovi]